MKKIVLSMIAAAAFMGSSAMADDKSCSLSNPFVGGSSEKSIYVGVDRVDFKDEGYTMSANGLVIGAEITHTYASDLFVGVGADLSYVRPTLGVNGDTNVYTLGAHTKLGYAANPQFAMYGILGANMQKIQYDIDPTLGYGYIYGIGTELKFTKDVVADVELKRGFIDAEGDIRDLRYEYKTVGVKLKYIF